MINEPSSIQSIPKFLIGSLVTICGLFGMTFEDSWGALLNNLIGDSNIHRLAYTFLISFLPLLLFISGLALALSSRHRKES